MELKSNYFNFHMKDLCKDILIGPMIEMIGELSANAMFVMNTDLDASTAARTTGTIVDILKDQKFRFMPISMVCEGFSRGSMGELGGTTRFTVRNVHIWMSAMYDRLAQINTESKTKSDEQRRAEEEKAFRRIMNRSNLYGSAFYWKISHCPMSDKEYDRLSLDKIVEAMEKGYSLKELEPSMIL